MKIWILFSKFRYERPKIYKTYLLKKGVLPKRREALFPKSLRWRKYVIDPGLRQHPDHHALPGHQLVLRRGGRGAVGGAVAGQPAGDLFCLVARAKRRT